MIIDFWGLFSTAKYVENNTWMKTLRQDDSRPWKVSFNILNINPLPDLFSQVTLFPGVLR